MQADVAPFPQLVVIFFGKAEQAGDHHDREAHAEVLDEVEALFADEGIEVLRAQLADALLESGNAPRGVGPADQLAERVVEGRVHHDHDGERGLLADGVEGDALG